MQLTKIRLRSKRILLVPINLKYAKDIFKEFTKEITTYMSPKPSKNIEELKKVFINKAIKYIKKGTDFQLIILKRKNKEFLGCLGLHKLKTKTPSFGIWIKKSAHGYGYGKEAAHKLKEWADKNLNYQYLRYSVDKRNIASKKIPESLNAIKTEYKGKKKTKKLRLIEYKIYKNIKDKETKTRAK